MHGYLRAKMPTVKSFFRLCKRGFCVLAFFVQPNFEWNQLEQKSVNEDPIG